MRKQSENIQSFTDIVDQLIQCQQLLTSGLLAAVAAAKSLQSCPTLCDPIDSVVSNSVTPWGYTVYGILQDRIAEWVAFPFSRGSSQPRDPTQVSCFAGRFFTS